MRTDSGFFQLLRLIQTTLVFRTGSTNTAKKRDPRLSDPGGGDSGGSQTRRASRRSHHPELLKQGELQLDAEDLPEAAQIIADRADLQVTERDPNQDITPLSRALNETIRRKKPSTSEVAAKSRARDL